MNISQLKLRREKFDEDDDDNADDDNDDDDDDDDDDNNNSVLKLATKIIEELSQPRVKSDGTQHTKARF